MIPFDTLPPDRIGRALSLKRSLPMFPGVPFLDGPPGGQAVIDLANAGIFANERNATDVVSMMRNVGGK